VSAAVGVLRGRLTNGVLNFCCLLSVCSIMGARNWCAVQYDDATGDLQFDLRVETEKGNAAKGTKSYKVKAPAPRWDIENSKHRLLHTKEWEKVIAGK
jgi:hypothetical protein